MATHGWFSAVTTEPPGIHLMLSPYHTRIVDDYLSDLEAAAQEAAESSGPVSPTRYS